MPSFALLTFLSTIFVSASAHLSILEVYGSNNVIGHGFGVNLDGKYPRTGTEGDAGGDSTVFETGTDNPSPACGNTPEWGPLDIPAWLSQAEGLGLPAAYSNLSVVALSFQVNRDGGGPMSCEYNEDATATSWKPMFMTLDQAGNSGILPVQRHNATVVMNFPEGAVCRGGWTTTACIVRCRTGVNKRFGGCFAVKLADSVASGVMRDVSTTDSLSNETDSTVASSTATGITDDQMTTLVNQVIMQMKAKGLVLSSSTGETKSTQTSTLTNITDSSDMETALSNKAALLTLPTVILPANEVKDNHQTSLTSGSTSTTTTKSHFKKVSQSKKRVHPCRSSR